METRSTTFQGGAFRERRAISVQEFSALLPSQEELQREFGAGIYLPVPAGVGSPIAVLVRRIDRNRPPSEVVHWYRV